MLHGLTNVLLREEFLCVLFTSESRVLYSAHLFSPRTDTVNHNLLGRRQKPFASLFTKRPGHAKPSPLSSENVQNINVTTGVVEPQVHIQSRDAVELLIGKVETDILQVLLQSLLVVALRDNGNAALGRPPQQYLSRGLPVPLCRILDRVTRKQRWTILSFLHLKLQETLGAEARVRSNGNALRVAKMQEPGLNEVRVVLNLESGRSDAGVSKKVLQQRTLEVGDTNGLGKTLVGELLHRLPGLLDGNVDLLDRTVGIMPAARVNILRIDVLGRDREVDEEQVEVVNTPPLELLAADRLDPLGLVEGVPQFRDNEELFTLHDALVESTFHALATLLLVGVICECMSRESRSGKRRRQTEGAIKQPIAALDSIVDNIGGGLVGDFPSTEPSPPLVRHA